MCIENTYALDVRGSHVYLVFPTVFEFFFLSLFIFFLQILHWQEEFGEERVLASLPDILRNLPKVWVASYLLLADKLNNSRCSDRRNLYRYTK